LAFTTGIQAHLCLVNHGGIQAEIMYNLRDLRAFRRMGFSRFSGRWILASAIVGTAGALALFALWHFGTPAPGFPRHPLRIGFESNPPVQIRSDVGFSGLSVEIVNEAAKRAGIPLQWVETGTSSEEAFQKRLVDLWPLMVDLPDRRKYVHFARPWMQSSDVLVLRAGTTNPERDFRGRIAVFKMPLHTRLLHERFPEAQSVVVPEIHDVLKQVCTGAAAAGFFEARVAQTELRAKPAECSSAMLRVQIIPDLRFQAGLASTFEAASAADQIQRQIDGMFRDGTLAALIAKYSYFGLDDAWASYQQIQAEERWKWFTSVGFGLMLVVAITLWLANSLRHRKLTEATLRESKERFRNLADNAPVMIVASGPDGRATFFSKTWLDFTGRTMEQEVGYGWLDNVHPEDRDRTRAEYARSFAGRRNCKIEYRLRRADGKYRSIACSGVPCLEPDGAFGGYIASCLDLTDIKSAQEEASERQNLENLGMLAGGIAHDFNNLLGGTLAYSELAQMKLAEGTSPDDELRQIRAVAIRGSEIVRQLMIFAGNERGTLELVDVSSLVRDMLELLKVSISKHAVLQTSLGRGLPGVRGNAAEIRQVVMNLATNASEAIGDRDGVIRVVTESVTVSSDSNLAGSKNLPEGDYLRLEVSDTGCGMTPGMQRKAFEPFFTTKFDGRGLGLAVVQRIVGNLGGTIHVESSVGRGTSVQILLPCVAETARTNDSSDAVDTPSRESQSRMRSTILIVEDEPVLLNAVSKMLQRRGFSVIQASDGSSALELIRAHKDRIDAMLLDVTLPGATSREVFEEAERLRPDLVAILTSAYSQESATASFHGLTVDHFIRKPFQIDDLVRLLQETLSDAFLAGAKQAQKAQVAP
jgi:PAS domain S-box-containing protein